MNLVERSQALLVDVEATAKLPLLMRAVKAEGLVREAAELLLRIAEQVDKDYAEFASMRARLLEWDAQFPTHGRIFRDA